jgi:hypothetical protein
VISTRMRAPNPPPVAAPHPSLALPFIHILEADVTEAGFAQATYRSSEELPLRLYNNATVPVRVCLGHSGVCCTDTAGHAALQGTGLTLQPGQTVKVATPTEGDYAITIADPASGTTMIDAVVHVNAPAEDNGPPYD